MSASLSGVMPAPSRVGKLGSTNSRNNSTCSRSSISSCSSRKSSDSGCGSRSNSDSGCGSRSSCDNDLGEFCFPFLEDECFEDDEVGLLFHDSDQETAAQALEPFSTRHDFPLDMEATLTAALTSQSLTPILKEELRCKIQLKRLARGKEELTPDFTAKTFSMSIDEVVKKNNKMKQNRDSAQRSRDRRKSFEKTIKSRMVQLEKENEELAGQAKSLRHACQVARQWLHQHRACLKHTMRLSSGSGLETGASRPTTASSLLASPTVPSLSSAVPDALSSP